MTRLQLDIIQVTKHVNCYVNKQLLFNSVIVSTNIMLFLLSSTTYDTFVVFQPKKMRVTFILYVKTYTEQKF